MRVDDAITIGILRSNSDWRRDIRHRLGARLDGRHGRHEGLFAGRNIIWLQVLGGLFQPAIKGRLRTRGSSRRIATRGLW